MTRWLPVILLAACVAEEPPSARVALPPSPPPPSIPLLCNDTDSVDSGLRRMGERPIAMGITLNNEIVVLYLSDTTWTLNLALHSGESCMLAAGHSWSTAREGSF